jgi:hypothetical protein
MKEALIIFLVIIIILFILPVVIVKNKGKNYLEKYISFLNNNGIRLSIEDENLIRFLVKDRYRDTIRWFIIGICISGFSPIIPFIGIISFLIIIFTFFSAFSKFSRECPYCRSKVNLSAERCHKCTKYIGNWWVGEPILEQYHKG